MMHSSPFILEANDNRTARRRHAEEMIEFAIALLDAVDGDCDLEPYLAAQGDPYKNDDREADEDGEPDDDGEPSLAAPENARGPYWCLGGDADLEEERIVTEFAEARQ